MRIDTLAYDKESNSFVIIEYKKDRNFSVVDQGIAYLNLMLNNKSDFILEYNERLSSRSMSDPLKRGEIEWSQSRIIFVAPEFTRYQQYAIGFRDFPIELWQIHKYEDNLILFEEIAPMERKESISSVAKEKYITAKVTEEIKIYTEDEHLSTVDKNIKDLYSELKSAILAIGDDIQLRCKKNYISFRRKPNFVAIRFRKSKLRLGFNIDVNHLNDPLKKAKKCI